MTDALIKSLKASKLEAERELNGIDQRRENLQKAIVGLERTLRSLGGATQSPTATKPPATVANRAGRTFRTRNNPGQKNDWTIIMPHVYEILRENVLEMHYLKIYKALIDRGISIDGQRPEVVLGSRLYNDDQLSRDKDGAYSLRKGSPWLRPGAAAPVKGNPLPSKSRD
jgi:hypothetical protein